MFLRTFYGLVYPHYFVHIDVIKQQKEKNLNPSAATELQPLTEVHAESRPEDIDNDLNLERLENETIGKSLLRHRYNISHAAKDLGLTRAALYRRMEKHGF